MSKTCYLCKQRKTYNFKVFHVDVLHHINGVVVCNDCIKRIGSDEEVKKEILHKMLQ
jgi:hypothetical protein